MVCKVKNKKQIRTTMEVYRFTYDKSEKTFEQPAFKKIWSEGFQKKLLSSQLLFVTKNQEQKLCSADLNSFTYYKIVEGLEKFGVLIDSKDLDLFEPKKNNDSFFIQFSDKIGARIDDNIMSVHFGKLKEYEKPRDEICKKLKFNETELEIFIVMRHLESKIMCFIFGRNGEDVTKPLTKRQVHHYLLCLYAFVEIK